MKAQGSVAHARVIELLETGYCILPDLLPRDAVAAIDATVAPLCALTPFSRGDFYGSRTKRFGRLLSREPLAAQMVQHSLIIDMVETVLGPFCDTIQLNVAQAIEIHPGELAQVPHRDQDMWAGEKGTIEYLVNVMWPLTPFTRETGATLLWPDTHGRKALEAPPESPGIAAECAPGSAIVFLGSTLHGGGANHSPTPRRGIVAGYSLGWLKAYENPFLAYPPAIARQFTPELAALVGYRQHRPNLGNYEGRCPSITLGEAVPDLPGAIDALTPGQVDMVRSYLEGQRAWPSTP